jgi:glycerol-3-phosphate acyltransferase PlsX
VDVIVTDGFTGNVALKTGEGALKFVGGLIKQVFAAGPLAKLGYLFARGSLRRLKETLDPRRYNGAVLLGLNGVVVKSHGGTDALGFAHAVDVALDMIDNDFNSRIAEGLAAMDSALLSAETASEPNV